MKTCILFSVGFYSFFALKKGRKLTLQKPVVIAEYSVVGIWVSLYFDFLHVQLICIIYVSYVFLFIFSFLLFFSSFAGGSVRTHQKVGSLKL